MLLYCARVLGAVVLLLALSVARAATQVVDAMIAEVTERGFVLSVGTEPLAVEDESGTRFWKARTPAERTAFQKGDAVRVRLKTDAAPTLVREMADRATAAWLVKIRKQPMAGTVKKVDARYVTLAFDDGSTFAYRATEKSDITLNGEKASATDLKEGAKVWVKGRTLPSLDTWLVTLSDKPILVATKTKKAKTTKAAKLASEGLLKGIIGDQVPAYHMFDIVADGRLLHVTYTSQTKFIQNGQPRAAKDMSKGMQTETKYRRDTFGRIIATKVELFAAPAS